METVSENRTDESWVEELEAPLSRYALSLGLSSHDAQDAVQESLIAFLRILDGTPESIRNPKAYAFSILRNNANKRFFTRSRRNEVEIPEEHPAVEVENDLFEDSLLKQSFQTAYAKLSNKEHDLLQKYYVERWTYDEIGAELGCSAQNVWKTIKKIVSQILAGELKRVLTKADPDFAKELFHHQKP